MTAARMNGTLVVGGGLAGAAAAIWLARAGRRVTLWERERRPAHKICGEFVSWEAQLHLADLGVDLDVLGAVAIDRVRLVTAARRTTGRLGFTARSVTRRVLDEALLQRAADAGATVERGRVAREVLADGTVVAAHGAWRPDQLMVATGKHNLRGVRRESGGTLNHQLGFKTYLRLASAQRAALAGHVELILLRGGYAGLQLVEQGAANFCFLVSPERWKRLGGDFAALLGDFASEVPHLARRLDGAVPLLDRPLAIAAVPYGFLHRPADGASAEPAWRLGDQAAVIPSFTGDGMSLALHSARLAANALLAGDSQSVYTRRLTADTEGPVRRATWMQRTFDDDNARNRMAGLLSRAPWLLGLCARWTRLGRGAVRRAGAY